MINPSDANASPVRNMTGSVQSASQEPVKPSAVATISTATPDNMLLLAAHTASPMTTSSSITGAFMIASQVFCTCMRENPEYIASNDALIMVLEHTVPAAMKAMYDVPKMSGSIRPSP